MGALVGGVGAFTKLPSSNVNGKKAIAAHDVT